MYRCESWTIKKTEHWRIDAFKLCFIGRTDAEAPILWPPDVKRRLIGKDPDAGNDWRQEEKGVTEDEMVGWHHWLNGHVKWKLLNRVWLFVTVHGILQARIPEWVAYLFSSGSSQPRNWTGVSWIAGRFFTNWAIREAPLEDKPFSKQNLTEHEPRHVYN